eukprot:GDKK01066567.1.p1 GENE.GDKK01066567.1~~GDKK01066567.1.p1  ORF type:complete len:119 (-),score=23.46 GDKK01066567.1:38-394(-)
MGSVQAQSEQVKAIMSATSEAIELCLGKVATATTEEIREMMAGLLQTTKASLASLQDEGEAEEADGSEEGTREDDDHSHNDSEYEREREEMGYQRLMDDTGDDDEGGGLQAEEEAAGH